MGGGGYYITVKQCKFFWHMYLYCPKLLNLFKDCGKKYSFKINPISKGTLFGYLKFEISNSSENILIWNSFCAHVRALKFLIVFWYAICIRYKENYLRSEFTFCRLIYRNMKLNILQQTDESCIPRLNIKCVMG